MYKLSYNNLRWPVCLDCQTRSIARSTRGSSCESKIIGVFAPKLIRNMWKAKVEVNYTKTAYVLFDVHSRQLRSIGRQCAFHWSIQRQRGFGCRDFGGQQRLKRRQCNACFSSSGTIEVLEHHGTAARVRWEQRLAHKSACRRCIGPVSLFGDIFFDRLYRLEGPIEEYLEHELELYRLEQAPDQDRSSTYSRSSRILCYW